MKSLITILLFVGSAAMGMTNMPEGNYQGKGQWSDNKGLTGNYGVSVYLKSGVVSSAYIFGNQKKKFVFETQAQANGHFNIAVNGHKVGEGYCMSVQCHYVISFGKMELEETFTFYQNNLWSWFEKGKR